MPQPLHFGEKSAKIAENAATPTLWAKIGQNRAKSDPSAHRTPARWHAQSLAIGSTARPFARIASPALTVARHIARPFICARPPAYLIAGQLTRSPDQSPARNIAARYWVTMGKKTPSVGAIMPGLTR